MAKIYVMDEWAKDRLEKQIAEAQTIEDIKKVLLQLLDELPVEPY